MGFRLHLSFVTQVEAKCYKLINRRYPSEKKYTNYVNFTFIIINMMRPWSPPESWWYLKEVSENTFLCIKDKENATHVRMFACEPDEEYNHVMTFKIIDGKPDYSMNYMTFPYTIIDPDEIYLHK